MSPGRSLCGDVRGQGHSAVICSGRPAATECHVSAGRHDHGQVAVCVWEGTECMCSHVCTTGDTGPGLVQSVGRRRGQQLGGSACWPSEMGGLRPASYQLCGFRKIS